AGLAHDRHRAITQRVELRQAARLVARRHDEEVAPRDDPMRETFVVAAAKRDALGPRLRRATQRRLEIGIAAAELREAGARALDERRQRIDEKIEALLLEQPADRA